jgi:hypothetical protein
MQLAPLHHGLPELQHQATAWLGVAPSAEQAEATDRVKKTEDYASKIHSALLKLNECVRPEVFRSTGDGVSPWRQGLLKPLGVLSGAVKQVDAWMRENRRQLAIKRNERDPEVGGPVHVDSP